MHPLLAPRRFAPPVVNTGSGSVIDTLVAAFEADHAARSLYPEAASYRAAFPGFAMALGGKAFTEGEVDLAPGAAALWLAPGVEVDGEALFEHLEATIPASRFAAMAAGMEVQGTLRPEEPHWYLPRIAVRPEAQGQGIGAELMRRGLARADRDGLPAYLEATNRRNATFYARHGFEAIGSVDMPGYPEIIAMWRPARTGHA